MPRTEPITVWLVYEDRAEKGESPALVEIFSNEQAANDTYDLLTEEAGVGAYFIEGRTVKVEAMKYD